MCCEQTTKTLFRRRCKECRLRPLLIPFVQQCVSVCTSHFVGHSYLPKIPNSLKMQPNSARQKLLAFTAIPQRSLFIFHKKSTTLI
jgi:hypothetical protein